MTGPYGDGRGLQVLFAIPAYHPNHDGMVTGMIEAGHRVDFILRRDDARAAPPAGAHVTEIPAPARGRIPPVRAFWRAIGERRPDVVVARNPTNYSHGLFLTCQARRVPFLLYVQYQEGCEALIPPRPTLLRLGLWPRHTLNTVARDPDPPPGKTCDFVPFAVETRGLAQRVHKAGAPMSVLAVGKLDQPRKNLAEVVRHLAPMLRDGAITLTLLGRRDDDPGPAFAALQAEIDAQGVAASVRLRENLSHAESLAEYPRHDLMLLASSRERASIAPAEALACGVPALCGSDNGTNYFVVPGETGEIFGDRDFAAMADRVRAFAEDPEARARMGAAGRRLIEREYSPARFAERFEAVLARRFGLARQGAA